MRRNHLLIAGASILVLMFGACSDDDDNGGKTDTGPGVEAGVDMAMQEDGGDVQDDTGTPSGGSVCVATCSEDAQCDENMHCLDGACVMCNEDADCEIEAYAGMFKGGCDTTTHACKMCAEDADCEIAEGVPMMTGVCHVASGQCLGCAEDVDCQYTGSTYAGCTDGVCVICQEDADCEGNNAGAFCVNNTCAMCKEDADCAESDKKGCHVDTGSCSLCTADEQCEGDLTCNADNGVCECTEDAQCSPLFPETQLDVACQEL